MKNNGEPTTAETPSDEIAEQSTLQPKNNGKQAEREQDAKTLPSEDKLDRNKANIQYMEIDAEGVKKIQIIKKTGEKETKIKRIIRPKKTRITKEIVEMTRSGLINVINFPSIDCRAGINCKKDERNFIKILKVNHHKIVNKNLNKDIFKSNMPTSEIH